MKTGVMYRSTGLYLSDMNLILSCNVKFSNVFAYPALYTTLYRENRVWTFPEAEKLLMQDKFPEFYVAKRIKFKSLTSFEKKIQTDCQ